MDILNYLQGMAVQHGPSGHEAEVSGWLKARFEALCDSVTIDPLYNVIALKKATAPTKDGSPAPRVMLAAHQDEIALMVADILPDGSLRMGRKSCWAWWGPPRRICSVPPTVSTTTSGKICSWTWDCRWIRCARRCA